MFSLLNEVTERSAIIYAIIGLCMINGINPGEWLEDILLRLSETKLSDLQLLLPNCWEKLACLISLNK